MSEKRLLELKRKYLLDKEGSIRGGLKSMADYAKIFYSEDEDELDKAIIEIMESEKDINIGFDIGFEEE